MWTSISKFGYKLGSPKFLYSSAKNMEPWVALSCIFLFIYGLTAGLWLTPPDYQQGEVYRIIYIHVPLAVMSLTIYMAMSAAVIIHFIWKIKTADIIAKVSAPLGAIITVLTLVTGSIWGIPTWGTFWIWDARLTSELILFFIYMGIIGIRLAIPQKELAMRASGILTLIGMINIPIIHYSVEWWQTLHQGATLLRLSKPAIAPVMLYPLLAMIAAFFFYYLWYLLIKVRHELITRENKAQWVKEIIMHKEM